MKLKRPARHGAASTMEMHAHGSNIDADLGGILSMDVPEFEWLACQCSCQRAYVKATQFEVRWEGVTRSCGFPGCEGELGDIIGANGSFPVGGKGPAWTGQGRRRYGNNHVLPPLPRRASSPQVRRVVVRLLPPLTGKVGRPSPGERLLFALRREQVREFWRDGLNVKQIADRLHVATYLVGNDLTYLRKRGKL